MLYAISGNYSNVRSEPGGKIIMTLGLGGIVADKVGEAEGWTHYDIGWINNSVHQAVEFKEVDLPMTWVSQLGKDADDNGGDCGAAAVWMGLSCFGLTGTATVNDIADQEFKLSRAKRLGTPLDVMSSFSRRGLMARTSIRMHILSLVDAMVRGLVVVQLFDYEKLPVKFDKKYHGGHFAPVKKITATGVTLYDPYWLVEPEHQEIPWATWAKIIGSSGYNYATQGVWAGMGI